MLFSPLQATFASALQINLGDIRTGKLLDNTIFGNKTMAKFGAEAGIGTGFNILGGSFCAVTGHSMKASNNHGIIWGCSFIGNLVNLIGTNSSNNVSNEIKQ